MKRSCNCLTEEDKTQVWFTNGLHNIVAQAQRNITDSLWSVCEKVLRNTFLDKTWSSTSDYPLGLNKGMVKGMDQSWVLDND